VHARKAQSAALPAREKIGCLKEEDPRTGVSIEKAPGSGVIMISYGKAIMDVIFFGVTSRSYNLDKQIRQSSTMHHDVDQHS
jgi:hypothetical protein